MAALEKQLAKKLKEAGTRLLSPPSTLDDLLPILDEVEKILENVEQSPSETMQDALWPTRNALISQELLNHSDPDVKVSVATCISEITRITAPDAPYNDDQMKAIFQLIVCSFEKLHDVSSRSYDKRTAILDIVAKVRSCVVMLDLECDTLILEMFQHFFKSVRDHHPEKVFSSMETIMILVIEESEEISPELLSSILETLKKDNSNVDPIARRLGENVLNKCASKVRPYLVQAIKMLGSSLDDYSNVVASVCQEISRDVDLSGVNTASLNSANQVDLPNPSSGGAVKDFFVQEVKETLKDTTTQEEVSPDPDKLESTLCNGNLLKAVEDAEVVKELLTEQKSDDHIENKAPEESKTNKDGAKVNPQPKGKSKKRRGRKGNLSKGTLKPSAEATHASDNDPEEVANLQESKNKDSGSMHCEDIPVDNTSLNSEKGDDIQQPLSKASENEALGAASPSPRGDTPEESHLKNVDREIEPEAVVQEVRTSPADSSKEPKADASDSKADKVTGQDISSPTDNEETSLHPVDDDRSNICSDTRTTKVSAKKLESGGDQQAEKKRKGQGKATSIKDNVKSPSKESDSSPKAATKSAKKEPSSASSKGKRAAGKEKASDSNKYGEEMIGSKIKVWWPKDKQFYEGVIESFSPTSKKHKVLYSDGDVEVLSLGKEKWEAMKDDGNSDKGYVSGGGNPDASEMRTKKKIKTNPDSSNKLGKSPLAKKRVGGTSSSRSKVAVSKPGSKQSNEMSVEKTSKVEDTKDGGGFEDDKGGNSSQANSGDESMDETPKAAAGKTKVDDDVETPKPSTKSKQQTAKGTKSKGKTVKGSGSKLNASKVGKGKAASSSASKGKESEKTNKLQNESAKSNQSVGKNKSSSSTPTKPQKVETNSGKKRKRGSKK